MFPVLGHKGSPLASCDSFLQMLENITSKSLSLSANAFYLFIFLILKNTCYGKANAFSAPVDHVCKEQFLGSPDLDKLSEIKFFKDFPQQSGCRFLSSPPWP